MPWPQRLIGLGLCLQYINRSGMRIVQNTRTPSIRRVVYKVVQIWPGLIFFKTIITKHLLAHVSLQRTPLRSEHNFSNVLEASWCLFQKDLWLAAYPLPNSLDDGRLSCGSFSTHSLPFLKHLHHPNTRVRERRSSPYCCWSLWWISADETFSPTRNLITMRCSTLRGTFCSLITLATSRLDWTGSNPSSREGGGCGFTLSRSHSCCAVRLVYTQISPGHIWTTLYKAKCIAKYLCDFFLSNQPDALIFQIFILL